MLPQPQSNPGVRHAHDDQARYESQRHDDNADFVGGRADVGIGHGALGTGDVDLGEVDGLWAHDDHVRQSDDNGEDDAHRQALSAVHGHWLLKSHNKMSR